MNSIPEFSVLSLLKGINHKRKQNFTNYDRFIPNRKHSNLEHTYTTTKELAPANLIYRIEVLGDKNGCSIKKSEDMKLNILSFKQPIKETPMNKANPLAKCDLISDLLDDIVLSRDASSRTDRNIDTKPYKVLDLPGMCDDFYINPLDWSHNGLVAIAIQDTVWLRNTVIHQNELLYTFPEAISSLKWQNRNTSTLVIGDAKGRVEIWDVLTKKCMKILNHHIDRVSVSEWCGENLLATGSKDQHIIVRDIRCNSNNRKNLAYNSAHEGEVCLLKWNSDNECLASGANDNLVNIWSIKNPSIPQLQFREHAAAVRAGSWSPHTRSVFVSGGGSADKTIRIWDTNTGEGLHSNRTEEGQICNLYWSKNSNEIVSTHGHPSNAITIWKYPFNNPVSLPGHTGRVLYFAIDPKEEKSFATAAADETLRFWHGFPLEKQIYNNKQKKTAPQFFQSIETKEIR